MSCKGTKAGVNHEKGASIAKSGANSAKVQ